MIYAHFIDNHNDKIIKKRQISSVPRQGDEIRLGGEGKEKYYQVIKVVYVYDEPINRVNIRCARVA